MGAEAARCCKGEPAVAHVDAAVAFAKLADAQEAVAVERRGVAVAAEACCCCEGVRAPPAAAGLDLSFSWGLLFNDVVVCFCPLNFFASVLQAASNHGRLPNSARSAHAAQWEPALAPVAAQHDCFA